MMVPRERMPSYLRRGGILSESIDVVQDFRDFDVKSVGSLCAIVKWWRLKGGFVRYTLGALKAFSSMNDLIKGVNKS